MVASGWQNFGPFNSTIEKKVERFPADLPTPAQPPPRQHTTIVVHLSSLMNLH